MSDSLPDEARQMFRGFLHEIRNPMSAVLTATALLRNPSSLAADEISQVLEMVDGETRRINDILNQFDHYLHLPPAVREPVDVAALTRRAVADLQAEKLWNDQVKLIDKLPPTRQIMGDEVQLNEAVRALLLNALQALESSAQTPLCIQLSMEEDAQNVALLVQDNGEGFNSESMQHAFEPFYSTRSGACGLGLPTAQAIARHHQGDLTIVSSSPQQSTCLRMTINNEQ